MEDKLFLKKLNRLMGNGHPMVKLYRKMESGIYRISRGDLKRIYRLFKKMPIKE
jgi:hypothetical protein